MNLRPDVCVSLDVQILDGFYDNLHFKITMTHQEATAAPFFAAATAFSDFAQPEASGVRAVQCSTSGHRSVFLGHPQYHT